MFALSIASGLLGWPYSGPNGIAENKLFWAFAVFAVFTEGHLILAGFRTHFNKEVFARNPVRFTVVPLVIFLLGGLSSWFLLTIVIINVWWDVYHSAMQTFGFGRIYDLRAGNDPNRLRKLDMWLNLTIYAGPILAGATLMEHANHIRVFGKLDAAFLSRTVPFYVESMAGNISRVVVTLSVLFLVYYVFQYWRHQRMGYNVSMQKVILLVSTSLTTMYAWYFNSIGLAFLIANLFHGLQYYAVVYWQERKNLTGVFRLTGVKRAPLLVLLIIALSGAFYGFVAALGVRTLGGVSQWYWSLFLTVAMMHFWYDGFIWSVRKKQVTVDGSS